LSEEEDFPIGATCKTKPSKKERKNQKKKEVIEEGERVGEKREV